MISAKHLLLTCLLSAVLIQNVDADESKPEKFVAASDVGHIELIVVDPDGKPIPHAQVEVRSHPRPDWEILHGAFIRKARYGTFIRADKAGRLRLKLPNEKLTHLNLSIRARGFGPFWAGWSMSEKTELLPASYTAHLDAGQSVGGIVVETNGQPVVGAQIHPSIEYKKRETDESQLGSGWRTKTDEDGRWRADCVPAAMDKLRLHIVHPDMVPTYVNIDTTKYRLMMDETPHEIITIDRGITLTGKVTDEDGQPIKDAKVRAAFLNETREAKTNEDGIYELPGCPEKLTVVTVTAKTFAPDQVEANLQADMQPVNFRLKPGNTIRVRVVDKDGQPEQKARIFFRRWRKDEYGKGLDTIHQYTDENGIWEWNEAPADAILVDVCPQGKVQIGDQSLIARDEEYVFTSSQMLTIEGLVLDAETRQPVELFRVIPGLKWPGRTNPHWSRRESFDGRQGKFHYKVDRMDVDHLIRIEAPGYWPLISRDVAVSEGKVKFEWQLKKAQDIEIKVEGPDGSPATDASAAVGIPGAQISLSDGKFRNTSAQTKQADQDGILKINPEAGPFMFVLVSKSGYAQLVCDPKQPPETIRLTAWATIEGQCRIGSQPGRDLNLVYTPYESLTVENLPFVSWRYRTQTNDDGRFQLKRILPGKGQLARVVRSHETETSSRTHHSHTRILNPQPGQKLNTNYGGNGRAVVGRAVVSNKIKDPVDWGFAIVMAEPVLGDPPAIPFPPNLEDERKAEWAKIWLQTPLGKQWQEINRQFNERRNSRARYVAAIAKDGSFRIDDLPAGKYEFGLTVESRPAERFARARTVAVWNDTVEIPAIKGEVEPLDLGELVVDPK